MSDCIRVSNYTKYAEEKLKESKVNNLPEKDGNANSMQVAEVLYVSDVSQAEIYKGILRGSSTQHEDMISVSGLNCGRSIVHYVPAKLSSWFAIWTPSQERVSDDGHPFDSHIFILFCTQQDTKVLQFSPGHSESNGLVQRGIQTVNQATQNK
jgi:hypothetical protein